MARVPESDRPGSWCCLLFAVWSWASFLTSPTPAFPHLSNRDGNPYSIDRTEDQSSTEGTGERGAVQTRKTARVWLSSLLSVPQS